MEVKRIDTYTDERFSRAALCQHGCFIADDMPFEIEIISDYEAIIKGENARLYQQIIDEFRFLPYMGRYIALDGHTRLYYAVVNKWKRIRAIVETSDNVIYGFVNEAQKRKIYVPEDMLLVSHNEYKEKWYRFCDEFFAKNKE